MQATRQHILSYLQSQRSASAGEMSLAFGMTAANLRHHLRLMREEGLVEVVRKLPAEGRGRPSALYGLTQGAQADNSRLLADALLSELTAAEVPKREETRLKRLARRMAGDEKPPQGQITQRLVGAVRRLDELGYRARWEARPGGPQVVLGHCPYASIIEKHPELCRMDAHLLEGLSGEAVVQLSKLEPGPEGPPQCVFTLRGAK